MTGDRSRHPEPHRYAQRFGVDLALARVHEDAREILESTGVIDQSGEHHVFGTVRQAVDGRDLGAHMIDADPTTREMPRTGGA